MSGMASTTRSPSSFSTSRNVVCVAGCCGPKFIVHRYGCGSSWARSPGELAAGKWHGRVSGNVTFGFAISSFRPRKHREIVPLAAALQADNPCAAERP